MTEIERIGVDTSKSVFTLHGIDEQDRPVIRRDLPRSAFIGFFAKLPPTEVVLEACGGSHHRARVLIALTLATEIDPAHFQSGRHLAAWIGLTPKERSTGGKQRMGGISRAAKERLRSLLVMGATAVVQHAKPGSKTASAWLLNFPERRPRKLAAVALANKMARITWAMMSTGEAYRGVPRPA